MSASRAATVGTGQLSVTLAAPRDLPDAERVMREVLENDLGGYHPQWHQDLDNLEAAYLRRPRSALLVARLGGELLGTAAVRPCELASPPNPGWLAGRYNQPDVCQLVRVWVAVRGRRRGLGRALVKDAVAWSTGPGGYRRVYLHTDAGVPGAEAFWRSLPVREVHDSRPDPFNCVHFEIDAETLLHRAVLWAPPGRALPRSPSMSRSRAPPGCVTGSSGCTRS